MSKHIANFPSGNTAGSAESDYTHIKVLNAQVSQMMNVVKSKSGDYEPVDGEIILMTTGSSVDVSITLPEIEGNEGSQITIVKVDAGTKKVLITGQGGETVNGLLGQELATQWTKMTVYATSTGWVIIA